MTFVKKAYDIARKKVFFCEANETLSNVARRFYTNNIGSIIVKDGEQIKGIITVNDLLRQYPNREHPKMLFAKNIMSRPVVTANKDTDLEELAEMFDEQGVSRLILLDDKKKVVGVVRDIALYKCLKFHRYDKKTRDVFGRNYFNKLY